MFDKKGIGPVVAIALLLVLVVVSLIGFQTWFNNYSSISFTNVEKTGNSKLNQGGIVSSIDGNLYFLNEDNNERVISVLVDKTECNLNLNISDGMNTLDIQNCTSGLSLGSHNVVVLTDKNLYDKNLYFKGGPFIGYFLDSEVEGLEYTTSSGESGVTGTGGSFEYTDSSGTVTFFIGNISLGTVQVDEYLTPKDFELNSLDIKTPTNIAKFLLALDSDSNESNGILINSSIRSLLALEDNLNFSLNYSNFDSVAQSLLTSVNGKTIKNETFSQNHLSNTLDSLGEFFCKDSYSGFNSGNGSQEDPYEICNCEQLQSITENNQNYFELVTDIDCDVAPYNTGSGFTPIGPSFSGTYVSLDGKGYSIDNLFINSSDDYLGLFKGVSVFFSNYGTIENLTLNNPRVYGNKSSSDNVGVLVSYLSGSSGIYLNEITINNAIVEGKSKVGGIVGYSRVLVKNSRVFNSYIEASDGSLGGIVGTGGGGETIINVSAVNVVLNSTKSSGAGYVGGIIGQLGLGGSTLDSSFSSGEIYINGTYWTGAITGYNWGSINNSYSNMSIIGSSLGQENGGISGKTRQNVSYTYYSGESVDNSIRTTFGTQSGGTYTEIYWNDDINLGVETTGTGLTTVQMKNASTYSLWDTNIWSIVDGSYPKLIWE